MNLNNLPVNAFDIIVLVVLGLGLFAGRKHGMSEELMNLVKWLSVVIGCSLVYEPVGRWMAQSSPFSLLASFLFVYAATALVILGLFAFVKHHLGGKLVGSDIFWAWVRAWCAAVACCWRRSLC